MAGRSWIKVFWLLALVPILYFLIRKSVAYMAEKVVYDGDRIEARTCRECLGGGEDGVYSRDFNGVAYTCAGCLGAGKVEVVLPGPNRPTKIWGAVVEWERTGGAINAESFRNLKATFPQSLLLSSREQEIRGSIAGARVVIEGAGEVHELKSNSSGRFGVILRPGTYTVKAEAPGLKPLEDRLVIEPLQSPIWLEKRKIQGMRPPDERRGGDGLAVVVCLDKSPRGGFLRAFLIPE